METTKYNAAAATKDGIDDPPATPCRRAALIDAEPGRPRGHGAPVDAARVPVASAAEQVLGLIAAALQDEVVASTTPNSGQKAEPINSRNPSYFVASKNSAINVPAIPPSSTSERVPTFGNRLCAETALE